MEFSKKSIVGEWKRLVTGVMAGVVGLTLLASQTGGTIHAAGPDASTDDSSAELVLQQLPSQVQESFSMTFWQLPAAKQVVVSSILDNLSPMTPTAVVIGTLEEAGALPS